MLGGRVDTDAQRGARSRAVRAEPVWAHCRFGCTVTCTRCLDKSVTPQVTESDVLLRLPEIGAEIETKSKMLERRVSVPPRTSESYRGCDSDWGERKKEAAVR